MNQDMEIIIKNKKVEISEQIHKNIDFLMNLSSFSKKEAFFYNISKNCGISERKIKGWYYYGHLPCLTNTDITIFCSYFKINFSDFIAKNITTNSIKTQKIEPFIPADIAKKNILYALIQHNIYDAQEFESRFEANYTAQYYYVLHRKNKHTRNISWNFLITATYYFNCSIGDFFKKT